ncbi:pilus assembly protein TadG-related protein [Thioclava sp. GXIMD4215]|uniref:pilus assembly protein TadG-related protein n=1 Tax=Thioclava sp. GXIMD4215 TaxID=3131928 RepID=UPI003243CCF8
MAHRRPCLTGLARRSLRRPLRLHHDETGAILPMTIVLLTVLLVLSGVALDFMRFEARRTEILAALDRASLAAASLSQDLDPKLVVEDYLKKAGLDGLDTTVTVEQGTWGEWRQVRIDAVDTMDTSFMGKLSQIGIKTLSTHISSQATEAIGNVEVSMVLDVSGSMGTSVGRNTTRISALRSSASTFVDLMFTKVQPASAPAGRLSISIIPYNQQVVLGSTLADEFNLSTDQTQTTCGDVFLLPSSSIAISPTTPIQRTMYGDSFDYTRQYNDDRYISDEISVLNCPQNSYATVLPFSNSQTAIKNKISGLQAGGDTAIDVGARWGLALLDPAAKPIVNSLINKGAVSSDLSARPYAYDLTGSKASNDRAIKVMVLMTDGQNTGSYSIKSAYRSGGSFFYSTASSTAFGTDQNSYNALFANMTAIDANLYYRYSDRYWYYKYGSQWYRKSGSPYSGQWSTTNSPGTLRQIAWSTVWSRNSVPHEYVIKTFMKPLYDALGANKSSKEIYELFSEQSERAATYSNITDDQHEKDAALDAVCTAAKANDILIYTLAVDAPSDGAAVLKSCSSGDGFYYDITSDELTNAFSKIAASINSLRLTN